MTETTITDLLAQRDALDIQIEAAQTAPLTAICEALSAPEVASALATVVENVGSLQGGARDQANNLITVLSHCPSMLAARLAAIIAGQPVEPEPEPEPELPPEE